MKMIDVLKVNSQILNAKLESSRLYDHIKGKNKAKVVVIKLQLLLFILDRLCNKTAT